MSPLEKQIENQQGKKLLTLVVKKYFLTIGKPNNREIHKILVKMHKELNLPGSPMGYSTLCEWVKTKIDPWLLTRAQQGRVAAMKHASTKTKIIEQQGFMVGVQHDCLHAPIILMSPSDYKAIKTLPIEYLSIEPVTKVLLGNTTNYYSGSESTQYLIEHLKHIILPKPVIHLEVGMPDKPFYPFGFMVSLIMDGAAQNRSTETMDFLKRYFILKLLTRTQQAKQKPHIESFNNTVKKQFLSKLPGYFNDGLDQDLRDTKSLLLNATLLPCEYEVLKWRFFIKYVYGSYFNKERGIKCNRHDDWNAQYSFQPPPIVNNLAIFCAEGKIAIEKTVIANEGFTFTNSFKVTRYNSSELQRCRVQAQNAFGKKFDGKLLINYTSTTPSLVVAQNPINSQLIKVPLVETDCHSPLYHGKDEFYKSLSEIDVSINLSEMTDEEIIAHAVQRKEKITKYKQKLKHQRAENAITVEEAQEKASTDFKEYLEKSIEQATAIPNIADLTLYEEQDEDIDKSHDPYNEEDMESWEDED